jgi:orotidine-5'-phosphate decarboxylase
MSGAEPTTSAASSALARPGSGAQRICAALDEPNPARARALAALLAGRVGLFKIGLELFVAHGRAALEAIWPLGAPIFLDLKLHDIPNTVEQAARGIGGLGSRSGSGSLGVGLTTVHAQGGRAMIAAARRGLLEGAGAAGLPVPRLLAVTVLTSLSEQDLAEVGLAGPARDAVLRLGALAISSGADGLVCSPAEVGLLRRELGPGPLLVVPGVRPAGSAAGDQSRTGTPEQAGADGADWLVIGRPLRSAPDPGAAAEAIARSIAGPDRP